jgi:hypothetical protein
MTDTSSSAAAVAALDAVTAALTAPEDRPGQRRMTELVAESIARDRHLVVQAGTGTGKTLAYLVPAIVSGKRTIVSHRHEGAAGSVGDQRPAVPRGRAGGAGPRRRLGGAEGTQQLPVPPAAARDEPAGDRTARAGGDVAAQPSGDRQAGRMGRHHRDRRPGRPRLEPEREHVARRERRLRRMPGRRPLPRRPGVLRGAGSPPCPGLRRDRRQHPPVRAPRRQRRCDPPRPRGGRVRRGPRPRGHHERHGRRPDRSRPIRDRRRHDAPVPRRPTARRVDHRPRLDPARSVHTVRQPAAADPAPRADRRGARGRTAAADPSW